MKTFVSLYAAASPAVPWDSRAEGALLDGFEAMDLAGLELPFTGALHRDEAWLLPRLRPQWKILVTLLPGTMDRLKADPAFGLASADAGGRRRALDFAEEARRSVRRLKGLAAVIVHSAPRLGGGARSSLEAFAQSLTELRTRDWGGAEILVEHCDAFSPERAPDKGFLRIEDECAALRLSEGGAPARMLINWGRSAIESRSAAGPLQHLRRANEAELLAGLFFSGATPSHPDYGSWKDSHAPFEASCPASILTPAAAKEALQEAGRVDYLGVKIQPLPVSLGTAERLAMIRAGLDALSSSGA